MDGIAVGQLALTAIGAAVALLTFWRAVNEYERQGTIKRIEFFLEARKRFKENTDFRRVLVLLESDDEALRSVSIDCKIEYVGFFEEVALLVNSGAVRKDIAQYMFGYYAMKLWDSENFWLLAHRPEKPLDKLNDPYWEIFRDFVAEMDPSKVPSHEGHSTNKRRYQL